MTKKEMADFHKRTTERIARKTALAPRPLTEAEKTRLADLRNKKRLAIDEAPRRIFA